MQRRHFLEWTTGAAAFWAAHGLLGDESRPPAIKKPANSRPLILELALRSAAPLGKLRDFYHDLLELPIIEDRVDRLTMAVGTTRLTFVPAVASDDQPFYHFAFNIPENKIEAAWRWQKERTPILPIPARLRDPKYPDDVVNYAHWNAHSIFFFDPAGNVVEYIARHDLGNPAAGPFTRDDILYASEIAFVTDDVLAVSSQLQELAGVSPFRRGGDENFMALGGENGLLLVMKRGRVISFDAAEKKAVSVCGTSAKVRGHKTGTHTIAGHPFELTLENA